MVRTGDEARRNGFGVAFGTGYGLQRYGRAFEVYLVQETASRGTRHFGGARLYSGFRTECVDTEETDYETVGGNIGACAAGDAGSRGAADDHGGGDRGGTDAVRSGT